MRNRDVKLKDNEQKKEANIARLMCEGVCARCRAKVQWRFQFSKYKPLKNLANCQNCKQKCVTKAYRTWCDKCASGKRACASCCEDMETANALYKKEADEKKAAKTAAVAAGASAEGGDGDGMDMDEDDEGGEDDDEGDDDEMRDDGGAAASSSSSVAAGDLSSSTGVGAAHLSFDERKFSQIAASKYSKDRKTGTSDDSVFKFEAAAAVGVGAATGGPSSSST